MDLVSLTLANPFKGYEKELTVERLSKINVFIGKNNSGKTQLLNQIHIGLSQQYESNQVLKKLCTRIEYPSERERLNSLLPQDSLWAISHDEDSKKIVGEISSTFSSSGTSKEELVRAIEIILTKRNWENVRLFFTFKKRDQTKEEKDSYVLEVGGNTVAENVLIKFSCIKLTAPNKVFNSLISMSNVKFLPALRILGSSSEVFDGNDIEDIDHSLDAILNSSFYVLDKINPELFIIPDLQFLIQRINEKKYEGVDQEFIERFNAAVNSLLPNISLKLEYREFESLLNYIEFDRQIDDWKQLGNGTQQLISLLFLFLLPGDFIYLVDEPEIGLHPGLQTKFLYFLQKIVLSQEEYSKQFFFATHSTSFIDFNLDTSHYVCEKTESAFTVDNLKRDDLDVIKDVLGLSPGALLQANGIIWVEGPSDRNYLTMLDEIFELNLKQKGILIRMTFSKDNVLAGHLTPKMFESSNSNFMVILDSDKESPREDLGWKERKLMEQYSRRGHLVYIPMKWRDIEGLLPQPILNAYFRIDTNNPRFREKDEFEKLDSYIQELKNKHLIPNDISGYSRKFHDSKKIVEMVLANQELREKVKVSSKVKEFVNTIKSQINQWTDHPELFNNHNKRNT